MASSTLRHSLLWALCFSPIALGLPGPSIINKAGGRTENVQSFHDSADLEQGFALEGRRTVLARAAAITPSNTSVAGFTYSGCYSDASNELAITPLYLLNAKSYVSASSMTWAACTSFCVGYHLFREHGSNLWWREPTHRVP
ncbi:hypothetical protein HBI24_157200 [Parastagonospora nodorum]|nr:hypothetical protein HBI10_144890 [Parastagonospora nodorum]KAH4019804.1 hypothetical protein HBI13_118030 [Parastagonospora nodorum]KAH4118669.1 hypothetical protein HBH47_134820 [Parastagonospora nodorum]KAH5034330.1 hypothetical protein HBI75_094600 [Parastagonospora nodorum]KAH5272620.1 hypothetical protein HBI72_049300 [Parastagonospora nodorum]